MLTTKMLGKETVAFISRENEIKILKSILDNNNFELDVIYGQRRI